MSIARNALHTKLLKGGAYIIQRAIDDLSLELIDELNVANQSFESLLARSGKFWHLEALWGKY
jgi:hypothetical protein